MFTLFKRNKKEPTDIFAIVNGNFKEIQDVPDPVFAGKMMGDGFAITPINKQIYAPIDGTIVGIFPTKHAISIETDNNVEILIHMGINTVELNGNGFEMKVQIGDNITRGQLLAEVDLNYLNEQEKTTDIILIFTNLTEQQKLNFKVKSGEIVDTSTLIAQITE